jgi:transposase
MSFVRRIKKKGRVYLAEVENTWVNGTCRQRHIRYLGREADGRTVLASSLSDARVDAVKLHGPLMVLHHLAGELGLPQELGAHSQEILSLVYAHCLDYQSLNHMPSWFERTDLNLILKLDGLTEKRLLDAMDSLEALPAEALQQRLFERLCARYHVRPKAVIYDVTNTYLYGGSCALGKPGHDKDGVKGRPLVQVGLSVTQEEGFPLFHQVFDGNVHDAKTLQDLIETCRRYRIPNGLFIYDRCIASKRNIMDINTLDWDTLCGIPLHDALKKLWRPWANPQQLIQLANRVPVGDNAFYVHTLAHRIDAVDGVLILCLNPKQRQALRESRYQDVLEAQQLLAQGRAIKAGLEKFFDGRSRLRQTTLARAGEFDGFCCLFCSKTLAPAQIVSLYFGKDVVEKAFCSLKGITQLRPIRHWLAGRVRAHVFLCYLAYLLLSSLKYRLRDTGGSVQDALDALSTVYKVYLRDAQKGFQLARLVTLSKKQDDIIKAVDPALLKS